MFSQNSNHLRSKYGERVSCNYAGCSSSFKSKSELDRHCLTLHEDRGIICGDCKNTDSNDPRKQRSDHFLRHLLKDHEVVGATKKSILTCSLQSCRPTNPNQRICFSTQESLNLHLQKAHGIASQSRFPRFLYISTCPLVAEVLTSSAGSGHVPLDHSLSSSSRGPTERSESLVSTKRLWEHNPLQVAKRLRYDIFPVA